LRIVRRILIGVFLLVAGAAAWCWWIFYRALPQIDGTTAVEGLTQQVTVDRDSWGVPHILAGSEADLAEAQGYVMAQDRLWQMDVLRRVASGELSEIFGRQTLLLDEQFRRIGLRQAAERDSKTLNPEQRMDFEAYARGVNRFIETHRNRLPLEFVALRYQPKPWTPADSLAVVGYMFQTLTNTWSAEVERQIVTERVGPDRARALFLVDSLDDLEIVGAEAANSTKAEKKSSAASRAPSLDEFAPASGLSGAQPSAWNNAQSMLDIFSNETRAVFGSNNWVVDGTHTASGKPLLSNDTHLELTMPSIWYTIHLTGPGWNVEGFALPGAPGIVIGHNDRIAWGFTNDMADVQDVYIEKLDPQNPHRYMVNGKYVNATLRTDRIPVRGESDVLIDILTTRHGPILRVVNGEGYALKWTALEPGALNHSYEWMGRARNWEEFREALRGVSGPAQNAVYADVDGNIGFIVAAWIPIRKEGHGEVPVPGDIDDYEWTGYVPFDDLPQALNPPGGIIVTANARVVGPGYKYYITDRWGAPDRTRRIYDLLAGRKDLRAEDMNSIQNDITSISDQRLAAILAAAERTATPKDPRTADLLKSLATWDGRCAADSTQAAFVEVARDFLLRDLLEPYLGANTSEYVWWRSNLFVERVLEQRPAAWLPPNYRSYDELIVAAADQSVAFLAAHFSNPKVSAWRLGALNVLTMDHPMGRDGILERLLSIGPTEQSGCFLAPKAMTHTHGPAMRMVADLSNWDQSLMELPTGESGQPWTAHYKDQFADWFAGKPVVSPFSEAAEDKARVHRLVLEPAAPR